MNENRIVPRKSVGDISFDYLAKDVVELGYVESISGFNKITYWHRYEKNGDLDCYVKDGGVICIACYRSCIFNDENLIGKGHSEIIRILGEPDEIGEALWVSEDDQQIPYEYDSLGLQVWFENGQVVSIFCNNTTDD